MRGAPRSLSSELATAIAVFVAGLLAAPASGLLGAALIAIAATLALRVLVAGLASARSALLRRRLRPIGDGRGT
jgi:hypothetical protein